jgi:hypothetical protein
MLPWRKVTWGRRTHFAIREDGVTAWTMKQDREVRRFYREWR